MLSALVFIIFKASLGIEKIFILNYSATIFNSFVIELEGKLEEVKHLIYFFMCLGIYKQSLFFSKALFPKVLKTQLL